MKNALVAALVLAGTALAVPAHAADADMQRLASNSGCLTCHQIEPGGKGPDGMAPIGPAWKAVAERYGFGDPERLRRACQRVLGISPVALRRV